MAAKILDGKKIAEKMKLDLYKKIKQSKLRPGLSAILVGNDRASELYIKLKESACNEVGINFNKYLCNEKCYKDASQKDLENLVKFINDDPATHGMLVQLPLPKKYNSKKILDTIDPKKDVEGFISDNKKILPPTVAGIIEMLKSTKVDMKDKKALVVVKSNIFMERAKEELENFGIKEVKSSKIIPKNSTDYDIIIMALGSAYALKKDMVKKGAIIIDVGTNKIKNKTVGDVDPSVSEIAGYLSPVPGGVGPLTVACLLKNTYLLSNQL